VLAGGQTTDARGGTERERLLGVYRGWKQALWRRDLLPTWLTPAGRRSLLTGQVVLAAILLIFLDEALWSVRLFTAIWTPLAPRSGSLVALGFFGAWAAGIWLLQGPLERITREPGRYRWWVLILRGVITGIPFLGLLAVPAWQRIEEISPNWLLRADTRSPELALDSAAEATSRRILHREIVGLMVGGYIVFGITVLWTARRALDDPSRRGLVLFLSVLLHAAAFASAQAYLGSEIVRSSSPRLSYRLAMAASLTWLVPVPYLPFLSVLSLQFLEPITARSHTLIWKALVRRQEVGRRPLWMRLEDTLRQNRGNSSLAERFRGPAPVGGEMHRSEHQVLKLFDLQTIALVLDAAVLAWGLAWLARTRPAAAHVLSTILPALWVASLTLAAAAVCLSALHFGAILFRVQGRLRLLDQHPYHRYLAGSQLALAAGLFLGLQVEVGQAKTASGLLMLLCALLVTIRAFYLIVFSPARLPRKTSQAQVVQEVAPLFVLMSMIGLGGRMDLMPELFVAWVAITPLRALALGQTLLPWLLRPFSVRDAFAADLSTRLRILIGFLAAVALLPFGGLGIPLCIWIRHRRWLDAKAFHWRRKGGSNDR